MLKEAFIAYATEYANKTSNVRISPIWESSGVSGINDKISRNFSAIIQLIQNNIEIGGDKAICKKDKFLLIYNFQPLYENYLCIDCVVRPIQNIECLSVSGYKIKEQMQISLAVDPISGEIMNNEMVFSRLKIERSSSNKKENPEVYGCYFDFIDVNKSYKDSKEAIFIQNTSIENDKSINKHHKNSEDQHKLVDMQENKIHNNDKTLDDSHDLKKEDLEIAPAITTLPVSNVVVPERKNWYNTLCYYWKLLTGKKDEKAKNSEVVKEVTNKNTVDDINSENSKKRKASDQNNTSDPKKQKYM